MAFSAGPVRPFRLWRPRWRWSRAALAWSAGVHALGFLLFGYATRDWTDGSALLPPVHTSRAYALHYLVLARPER